MATVINEIARFDLDTSDGRRALDAYIAKLEKLERKIDSLVEGTDDYKKAEKELAAETKKLATAIDVEAKSAAGAAAKLDGLRKVTDNLDKSTDEYKKGLKDTNTEIDNLASKSGEASKQTQSLGGFLKTGAAALGGLVLAGVGIDAIVGGITALNDTAAILNVRLDNVRKKFEELDETGARALTARIQASADTFVEGDFDGILDVVNSISKASGDLPDDVLGVLNEKLLLSTDTFRDELLTQAVEYANVFAQYGVSVNDSLDVILAGDKLGLYADSASVIVEEAGIRLSEATKGTVDAVENAFGSDFTDKLFADIQSGDITAFEALQRISQELADTDINPQQYQELVSTITAAGGEKGGAFLEVVKDIGKETNNTTAELSDLQIAQQQQLALSERLAASQVELATRLGGAQGAFANISTTVRIFVFDLLLRFADTLQTRIFPVLGSIGERVLTLAERFGFVRGEISFLDTAINLVAFAFEGIVKQIEFTLFVTDKLIQGFTFLVDNLPFVQTQINFLTGAFGLLQDAINDTPAFLNGLLEAAKTSVTSIGTIFSTTFGGIGDIIKGALTFDTDLIAEGLRNATFGGFADYGSQVADAYNRGFSSSFTNSFGEGVESSFDNLNKKISDAAAITGAGNTPFDVVEKKAKVAKKAVEVLQGTLAALEKQLSDAKSILQNKILLVDDAAVEKQVKLIEQLTEKVELEKRKIDAILNPRITSAAAPIGAIDAPTSVGSAPVVPQLENDIIRLEEKLLDEKRILEQSKAQAIQLAIEKGESVEEIEKEFDRKSRLLENRIEQQILEKQIRIEFITDTPDSEFGEAEKRLSEFQLKLDELKTEEIKLKVEVDTNDAAKKILAFFESPEFKAISELATTAANVVSSIFDRQVSETENAVDRQKAALDAILNNQETATARQVQAERERLAALEAEREKAVQRQQALAAIQVAAELAVAVAKTAAESGVAAPITIITTLTAVLAALASIPGVVDQFFYEGTEYVTRGKGEKRGIDTVSAKLTEGERVVTKDTNARYWDTLSAIHNGTIPASVLNDFVLKYNTPLSGYSASDTIAPLGVASVFELNASQGADMGGVTDAIKAQTSELKRLGGRMQSVEFYLDENGFSRRVTKGLTERAARRRRH